MTTHPSPTQASGSSSPQESGQDPHRSLHSETGGLRGEHPGRSKDPLVKVAGLAWLEFEKPDLDRAERFGTDFGFTVADRTPDTVLLRGRQAAAACLVVRRGPQARFVGPAFAAAARDDLDRLARGTGGTVTAHWGGHAVLLRDPSGYPGARGARRPGPARAARARPAAAELRAPSRPASTPPSGRPGGRRRSSGWDTWCWAPPGSARPWTGTWTRSG